MKRWRFIFQRRTDQTTTDPNIDASSSGLTYSSGGDGSRGSIREMICQHSLKVGIPLTFALLAASAVLVIGETTPEAAATDPRIAHVLGELGKVTNIHQAAISPDGKRVAWAVDRAGEAGHPQVSVAPASDAEQAQQITAGKKSTVCEESDLAWSPDSRSLAFLSDCESPGQTEVYVAEPGSTGSKQAPRRLTHLHGLAQSLQWSPDASRIGFLYVAAVELAKCELRQLTPAARHVFEFDWSPDSTKLAYVAGENNSWVAQLFTQAVDATLTGGKPLATLDPSKVTGPLTKSSAITFFHQAKTPTLVVVGDHDGECPAPQSFEFWHALRAQGTPTKLVVYPNEGHRFVDPAHWVDVLARALNWFEQYMPAN